MKKKERKNLEAKWQFLFSFPKIINSLNDFKSSIRSIRWSELAVIRKEKWFYNNNSRGFNMMRKK